MQAHPLILFLFLRKQMRSEGFLVTITGHAGNSVSKWEQIVFKGCWSILNYLAASRRRGRVALQITNGTNDPRMRFQFSLI